MTFWSWVGLALAVIAAIAIVHVLRSIAGDDVWLTDDALKEVRRAENQRAAWEAYQDNPTPRKRERLERDRSKRGAYTRPA